MGSVLPEPYIGDKIDDWNAVKGCKVAVNDYRKTHDIKEKIKEIDLTTVYWKKG